jgi:hypothetical protein
MHPNCRQQVNAALAAQGRNALTPAREAAIDARMSATMRRLARTDPNWQALSRDQRMMAAAQSAMADIGAEAARKVANAQRQAIRTAEVEQRLSSAMGRTKGSRTDALVGDMELSGHYVEGIKRDATRGLLDLIEASSSKDGAGAGRRALMTLFDAENPAMTRALALEVFARGKGGTGNPEARAGADAWLKTIETLRQRFNNAGGDVGQLDYGYLPQAHDPQAVRRAGAADWIAAQQSAMGAAWTGAKAIVKDPPPSFSANYWANKVLPMLDRTRYVLEDGARMSDAEVLDVLRGAWETISSDGMNKTTPGAGPAPGSSARANRGAESREIHFKDGEAYLDYLGTFGTGSMYDAMIGHIGGMSRDIGLVERYGPNPNAQMRLQLDLAQRADGGEQRVFGIRPESYWSSLNGTAGTPRSARLAQLGQHVRNVQVFGKLQGAVLSSVTDLGTYFVTTGFNRLSYWDAMRNLGRAGGAEAKEFMNAHGMIAESLVSDLNRWSGENVANNWSGRISNATMRLSLMNAWTDTLRRAFQLTHMAGVGKMAKKGWAQLDEYDRWRLESKGLTEPEWEVIRSATPEQFRGQDMITPEGIYATGNPEAGTIVAKYLGMLTDESEFAVINPDMATKVMGSMGGTQAGTFRGELARAVMQFKSFPIAMVSRHWRRALQTPQGLEGAPMNRVAYAGALMVSLTALGAIAFQTKQMVSGKDPVDMTTGKFWTRAFAQGGGAGFLGDVLLRDSTDDRSPQQGLFELLGPSAGSAAQLYELSKGNFDEWNAGKDTHAGAEALRFARGHMPLVNLWYAKTALDHAGLHALQENLSPGYLARIQNKAKKDWGQEYWWEPGTGGPERAPDLSAVAGE